MSKKEHAIYNEKTNYARENVNHTSVNHHFRYRDLLDMWMNNNQIRLKPTTLTKYQNLIDMHILPELGNLALHQLNATCINTFLANKLQNGRLDGNGGLSPSYVRSIALIINATIAFAVNEQFMEPLRSPIHKPTLPKKELSILTVSDQKNLEEFLQKDFAPTNAAILLSLHAGLRIGEICALTWEDIDLDHKIIYVRHTVARIKKAGTPSTTQLILTSPKTLSSKRAIPLTTLLYTYLSRLSFLSTSNYVISDSNRFMNPRTLEYRYHRILDKCGIKSINFHALRHTFASRCVAAGVDVKSLSEILGHGNVSITLNTYVHSSMEQKREQLEKMYLSF